ncbi:haloacid dehalogenase [Labrys miyagiensis]|uniref:phosphoglycolate phosphatase n=1 Tax=Labrys miyagiensis TaxID=346912 RepID=A0ABQ6CUV5_9HYPH|nr:HAD family hydrolase [Labrys miyagiensis]GLS23464.1 haloacid dehalogenase [Labrys miyagiensis]
MPIRAILFDKDGTLVDFHLTWSAATYAAMQRLSAGNEEKMARLVEINDYDLKNHRIRPTSVLVAQSSADYGVTWAHALGETADDAFFARMDRIFIEEGLKHVTPIGDPPWLLSTLKAKGYLTGICTNDSEVGARAHCEKLGLLPWLDAVLGYDSGHGRKPDPGPVLGFAADFGIPPQEVALVGDSTHDLHAVKAAGGTAIAVLSGFAGREELAPHADHVIDSVMDLPALLETLER